MVNLTIYLPNAIPDNLFTRNELNSMGLVPIYPEEPDALVDFLKHKRTYKLYKINKTKEPRRQKAKAYSLVVRDNTVDDILEKRKKRKDAFL